MSVAKSFSDILKFNPYHDRLGRFTSAGSASSMTIRTRWGLWQNAANKAIQREKERTDVNTVKTTAGTLKMPKLTGDRASEAEEKRRKNIEEIEASALKRMERMGVKNPKLSDKLKEQIETWVSENNDTAFWNKQHSLDEVLKFKSKAQKEQEEFERKDREAYLKAKDRSAGKRTQAYRRYEEYERSLMDKYPPKDSYDRTSWYSRATDAERAKLKELDDARVFRNKRGQWQIAKSFSDLMKFNPYHDRLGRFTFANSATSFTYKPGQGKMYDNAIAREKERTAAMAQAEKPKKEEPKKIESNFKPAKNKKEAIQYAKTELGFDMVSYGTKLDIDTINHINKQVADIQANYPEVKGAVQQLKTTTSKRAYAQISTDLFGGMSLEIGSHLYGQGMAQLEKGYEQDVKCGFHPKGTSAKDIIWHEYGHVIGGVHAKQKVGVAANEKISSFDDRREFINLKRTGGWEKEVYKQATGKEYSRSGANDFANKISKYATVNAKELFAEAFAEFNGSANPSPESIALMKAAGVFK